MRAFAVLPASLALIVALFASAGEVCQDGHCISDPSLTSDRTPTAYSSGATGSTIFNPNFNFNAYAADASSPLATAADAADASNYSAVSAAGSGSGGGTHCVSPYPDLPLSAGQQQACLAAVEVLKAEAKKKAQEEAERNKPQEKPQQQPPPPPQGGGGQPKGGDDKGDNAGGDECDKKLKEIVKKCAGKHDEAAANCDPNTSQTLNTAMAGMMGATQGMGNTSFNSSNQASGGCAIGSQGMTGFAGECDSGKMGPDGKKTAGNEMCSDECAKQIQAAMREPACQKEGGEEKKQKAKKKLMSKKAACEKLKEVSAAARQNADSLGQCSQQAGQNAGMGAGGMGDMMKALGEMAKKAQEEQDRQQQNPQGEVAVNQCDSPTVQSIPQLCTCPKNGYSAQQCASLAGLPYNPTGPGGSNGSANGNANGSANGSANGNANGSANGSIPAWERSPASFLDGVTGP